jgi:hypothetical protein
MYKPDSDSIVVGRQKPYEPSITQPDPQYARWNQGVISHKRGANKQPIAYLRPEEAYKHWHDDEMPISARLIRDKLNEARKKTEKLRLFCAVVCDKLTDDQVDRLFRENNAEDIAKEISAIKRPEIESRMLKLLQSIIDDIIFSPKQGGGCKNIYSAWDYVVKYLSRESCCPNPTECHDRFAPISKGEYFDHLTNVVKVCIMRPHINIKFPGGYIDRGYKK